eukprot:403373732
MESTNIQKVEVDPTQAINYNIELTSDPTLIQHIKDQSEIFKSIEAAFPFEEANRISQDERLISLGEVEFDMTPYTYGEIDFNSFADILLGLQQNHGLFSSEEKNSKVFYDLGSGFGKPCIAAALILQSHLKKCVGVEFLEGLFNKSLDLKTYYDGLPLTDALQTKPELEFKKDDFLKNTEWALEADIVFANATCFEPQMVVEISKALCEKLKKGSIVILSTKSLTYEGEVFKKIGPFKKTMSWGSTNVSAYIKL